MLNAGNYVNTLDKLPKVAEEDMLKTRDNLGEYSSTLTGLSIILRISKGK